MHNEDPLTTDPDPTQSVEKQLHTNQKPSKENRKKAPYAVIITILTILLFGAIGVAVYLFIKPANTQNANTMQRIEQTSAADFIASVKLRLEQLEADYPEMTTVRSESSESLYWYEPGEYFVTNGSTASVSLSVYEKPFTDTDTIGQPIYPELSKDFIAAAKDILTTTVFDDNNGFTLIPTNNDPILGTIYQSNLIGCTVSLESEISLRCNHLNQFSDEDVAPYEPYVSAYRANENTDPVVVSGVLFLEKGNNPATGVYTDAISFGGFRGPTVGSLYYKVAGVNDWRFLTVIATAIPCSTFNTNVLQQIFEGYNCQREENDARDSIVTAE